MRTHARRLFLAAFLLAFCHTASAFYDPNVGRWISPDPIGEEGGTNLWASTSNNPISLTDALGFDTYVIIYYSNDSQSAFKQAADTRKREIEARSEFNSACDRVLLKGALTATDFIAAWESAKCATDGDDPNLKVKEVAIFSHSGPGRLFFQASSVGPQTLRTLSDLNWSPGGTVRCHGCSTGLNDPDGSSVAGSLTQG